MCVWAAVGLLEYKNLQIVNVVIGAFSLYLFDSIHTYIHLYLCTESVLMHNQRTSRCISFKHVHFILVLLLYYSAELIVIIRHTHTLPTSPFRFRMREKRRRSQRNGTQFYMVTFQCSICISVDCTYVLYVSEMWVSHSWAHAHSWEIYFEYINRIGLIISIHSLHTHFPFHYFFLSLSLISFISFIVASSFASVIFFLLIPSEATNIFLLNLLKSKCRFAHSAHTHIEFIS